MAKRKTDEQKREEFRVALKAAIADDLVDGDGHSFLDINLYIPHFHQWAKKLAKFAFVAQCNDGKYRLCVPTEAMHHWMIGMAGITEYHQYLGRGSQTREWARLLHAWAKQGEAAAPQVTTASDANLIDQINHFL